MSEVTMQQDMFETPFGALLREKLDLEDKRQRANDALSQFHVKLQNFQCPHEKVERHERYYPGDYYDRASTEVWDACVLCGNVHNVSQKTGSHG